jgi:uncharacterized membrane protein (UPF0127 family)
MGNFFKNKFFVFVIILVFFAIISYFTLYDKGFKWVYINGYILKAEVVSDGESLARGLSGRDSIGDKEAMLFVFKLPYKWGIWMKDMKFPIDVIWMDEKGRIVYLVSKMDPKTYSEAFYPKEDSLYVLETAPSFIERSKTKIGDYVIFYK